MATSTIFFSIVAKWVELNYPEDPEEPEEPEFDIYEYDIQIVTDYDEAVKLMNRKAKNNGWRVLTMTKMGCQYRILFEKKKLNR